MSRLTEIQNKIDSILNEENVNLKRLSFYYEKEKELKDYIQWSRSCRFEAIGI